MTSVNESYVISFENEEHKSYVELVQDYGFDMLISANLRAGLTFVHPIKRHIVRLDKDEGAPIGELYEPHLFIFVRPLNVIANVAPDVPPMSAYDTPMHPEHYSDVEWEWLQGDRPSDFEFLKRELHIWLKVRPHYMNTLRADLDI